VPGPPGAACLGPRAWGRAPGAAWCRPGLRSRWPGPRTAAAAAHLPPWAAYRRRGRMLASACALRGARMRGSRGRGPTPPRAPGDADGITHGADRLTPCGRALWSRHPLPCVNLIPSNFVRFCAQVLQQRRGRACRCLAPPRHSTAAPAPCPRGAPAPAPRRAAPPGGLVHAVCKGHWGCVSVVQVALPMRLYTRPKATVAPHPFPCPAGSPQGRMRFTCESIPHLQPPRPRPQPRLVSPRAARPREHAPQAARPLHPRAPKQQQTGV
jgi:hypothetical protein